MKNILILMGIIMASAAGAQSDREWEFQIRAGFGFEAYASNRDLRYELGGFENTDKETGEAVTKFIPIEFRFEFHPRFNAGIDMKFGSSIYETAKGKSGKSNRFATIGIGLELNLVNRPNFRWYVGMGFNSTGLEVVEEKFLGSISYNETATWRGGGFKMNSGVLIFFGDSRIGMNTNLGYDGHNLKLRDFSRDDSSLNIDGLSGDLTIRGVDWTLGLVVRLY